LRGGGVDFDEVGKIDPVTKAGVNGSDVGLEAVRRDLELAVCRCRPQFGDKILSRDSGGLPSLEGQNQFGTPLQGHKAVGVADGLIVRLFRPSVGFLLED
jgi:hypothetical protein